MHHGLGGGGWTPLMGRNNFMWDTLSWDTGTESRDRLRRQKVALDWAEISIGSKFLVLKRDIF